MIYQQSSNTKKANKCITRSLENAETVYATLKTPQAKKILEILQELYDVSKSSLTL